MKPHATLKRLSDGRISVTDWHGKDHKFQSIDNAIAFAGKLYGQKPNRAPAEKDIHPRWGKNFRVISTRVHKFSKGRAKSD